MPLSPYVEKPLNSKVIKSFVPELRNRKCFSCFCYILICRFMQKESQRHNVKGRAKASLKKYTSHFIVAFACERELETKQRLQHIDLTSPSGHSRVSFSFSWAAKPEGRRPTLLGAGFFYRILSPTGLQTHWGWVWISLPHLVSNSSDSNSLTFCPHRVI